jgi:hypothetical protein
MLQQMYLCRNGKRIQTTGVERVGAGLYIDSAGVSYLCVSEFLAANGLPATAEICEALVEEAAQGFPDITCIEFEDY